MRSRDRVRMRPLNPLEGFNVLHPTGRAIKYDPDPWSKSLATMSPLPGLGIMHYSLFTVWYAMDGIVAVCRANRNGKHHATAVKLRVALRSVWWILLSLALHAADASAWAASTNIEALTRRAAAGEAQALFQLGDMHERAEGLEYDSRVAATYMQLAAERGYPPAQYRLGLLYAGGLGVAKDLVASYAWLTLAAAADTEVATRLLAESLRDGVAMQMTTADVDRARARAASFRRRSGSVDLPGRPAPNGERVAAAAAPPNMVVIKRHLAHLECGDPRLTRAGKSGYRVAAYVPRGDGTARLTDAAEAYFARHSIAVTLIELDPGVCGVMKMMVSHAGKLDETLGVVLRNAKGQAADVFRNKDYLVIGIPPLTDGRFVTIEYFTHDGQVLHMLPNRSFRGNFLAAGREHVFGEPKGGQQVWQIGPPFGNDLLVVFLSKRPLYSGRRSDVEKTADYVAFLRRRLGSTAPSDTIRFQYRVVRTVAE